MKWLKRLIQKLKAASQNQQQNQNQKSNPVFKPKDPDRVSSDVSGQKLLVCPLAEQARPEHDMSKNTQGNFSGGYPKGLLVHFSAGSSAESTMSWGKSQGLCFWMIKKDGTIIQTHRLNRWGSHAGKSSYPGLGVSVSRHLLGVEIDNAGMLSEKNGELVSWFGRKFSRDKCRFFPKSKDNVQAGWYERYTPEQEQSLKELCLWLYKNNSEVFSLDFVVGHDEVSPGRKNDPGGALSMTMPEFRAMLKKEL